jgi:ABC-type glycerol-3-phosphate transport system permease component
MRQKVLRTVEILVFVLLILFSLAPIFWGALTSFKSAREIYAYPPKFLNFTPVLDNYRIIIEGGYLRNFLNSVVYSLTSIIVGLFFGMLAAYGLQRYNFPGKKFLFYMVVAGIPLSIGSAALLIPNYLYMSNLGLTNKLFTLPILYAAYNLPMAIWIMKGGLESVPAQIDEAALIDGCTRSYIIFRLIPVLNRPAMASAALFIFLGAWNEFIVAAVMIDTASLRPLQLTIYHYMGFFGLDWGLLTSSAIFAVIPTLIVFTFLGKLLVSGLTQGAVKG